jgi:hypothetical protein
MDETGGRHAIPSNVLAWDLGDGESSVLAWALSHPGTPAIIDDPEGRRCAESLGITLRGPFSNCRTLASVYDRIAEAKKTAVDPQNVLTEAERYAGGRSSVSSTTAPAWAYRTQCRWHCPRRFHLRPAL